MTDYTVACSVVDKSHVTGIESDSNSVWKNTSIFIELVFSYDVIKIVKSNLLILQSYSLHKF